MTSLRTPRLLLRRARVSDLEALHAVLSDEEAMKYWSTEPHRDLETTRRWLEAMMASEPEVSEDFVIECAGSVVGKVGFYRLPEIGFILSREHWGRGLAFEATRAVIDYVFATRDLGALSADVDPRNAASLRLLHRLGFTETGREEKTYRVGGVWTDSVYLTRLRTA